jgi:hypothetical protein
MGSHRIISGIYARFLLTALVCLALTGCFFLPGQFESSLDIRRDGRFTYRYTGEIVFLFPQELDEEEWQDSMAICSTSSAEAPDVTRPCTQDEVASKRANFEASKRRDRDMGEEIAQLIGYNPVDAKGNMQLAEELKKYPGWNDVRYLGKGKFYVDYQMSGMLDRSFAFPVIPQVQTAMPFISVAPDRRGNVMVTAAGLASRQLRTMVIGQMPQSDRDDPITQETQALLNLSQGTFTIMTDAEITETNGIATGTPNERRVEWKIEGSNSVTPKLQLGLAR